LRASNRTRVASAFNSIRNRSGYRRATDSSRSRAPARPWLSVVSGVYRAPTSSCLTTRQSFGSPSASSRESDGAPNSFSTLFTDSAITLRTCGSPIASGGAEIFEVAERDIVINVVIGRKHES
jgi:hypothetical protein